MKVWIMFIFTIPTFPQAGFKNNKWKLDDNSRLDINEIHYYIYNMRFCLVGDISLQWRHNGRDSVSNHQPRDGLLNRLFGRRS